LPQRRVEGITWLICDCNDIEWLTASVADPHRLRHCHIGRKCRVLRSVLQRRFYRVRFTNRLCKGERCEGPIVHKHPVRLGRRRQLKAVEYRRSLTRILDRFTCRKGDRPGCDP